MKDSAIGWTDHTFNAWWGCDEVEDDPACQPCYARRFAKRLGLHLWGANAPRRFFGEKYWQQPLAWNRAAERTGRPARVFCLSMGDLLEDRADLDPWRAKLWHLIEVTPHLIWMLLTKRPERFSMVPPEIVRRIWAGTTVATQRYIERIAHLPAEARVRFVSAEPLLGPIDLGDYVKRLHWVIIGGVSGAHLREMNLDDARALVEQAHRAGLAVYVKQDSGPKAGQQGGIPAEWCSKEWPDA